MNPINRFKSFLHLATVTQWMHLEKEHRERTLAGGAERAKVMGLYVLAMLVLIAIEYLPRDSYNLLVKEHVPRDLRRFGRDLWWCWFVIASYSVLPALYCSRVLKLSLKDLGLSPRGFLKHAWIYVCLLYTSPSPRD